MARSFDGSLLMIPSASATALFDAMTVCCWAKFSALRSGIRSNGLLDLTWGTPNVTGTDWFYFSLNDDKTLRLRWGFTTNDTPDTVVSTAAASINAGEWHHLAVTANQRSSPTLKFYVDGVQLGTNVSGTNMVGLSAASSLYVGGHARDYIGHTFGDQSYWQGSIAEIGIWTAALNAATIASLAAGRPPGFIHPNLYAASGLVGYGSSEAVEGQTYTLTANGAAMDLDHPPMDFGGPGGDLGLPPRGSVKAIAI